MDKLKGKFTQRWLSASDKYYLPIFERLFYAQYAYLDRKGYTFPLEFLKAAVEADKEGKIFDEVEGLEELLKPLKDKIEA